MKRIWTDDATQDLVDFVNEAVRRGTPKLKAYAEFCRLRGDEYKPTTAAVQYARYYRPHTQDGDQRYGLYTVSEKRFVLLSSHFAPRYNLRKRDVYRALGKLLRRDFKAIEQLAYRLTQEVDKDSIPAAAPVDVAEFLQDIISTVDIHNDADVAAALAALRYRYRKLAKDIEIALAETNRLVELLTQDAS